MVAYTLTLAETGAWAVSYGQVTPVKVLVSDERGTHGKVVAYTRTLADTAFIMNETLLFLMSEVPL